MVRAILKLSMKPGWDCAELKGLSFTQVSQAPHVLLELTDDRRVLMVPVGMHEAQAILEALDPEVPSDTAYDVVTDLLESHRLEPQCLEIDSERNGSLVATFRYGGENRSHFLKLTPSRGLAMAAKSNIPVFLRKRVSKHLGSVATSNIGLASDHVSIAQRPQSTER
jgi:bifunctional DNase/RNase